LEGLRSSMNEVLHDPDPSALRASLSDGMLEQALTADVLSGDETIAVQVGIICAFLWQPQKYAWFFPPNLFSLIFLCFPKLATSSLPPTQVLEVTEDEAKADTIWGTILRVTDGKHQGLCYAATQLQAALRAAPNHCIIQITEWHAHAATSLAGVGGAALLIMDCQVIPP